MNHWENKTCLITGASSGLGQAVGLQLAAEGARLVLVGRREAEIRQAFPDPKHLVVVCDVSDEASVQAAAAGLKTAAISLQGVVLAAGVQEVRPLAMETLHTLEKTWRVNIYGSLGFLALLLKSRMVAKAGSIVFISSAAARAGSPGLVSYAASKGALEAAVRSLALELASQKIRVNAIAPGVIPTPMSSQYLNRLTAAQVEAVQAKHPLGFGESQDVAAAAVFLLSGAAKWITGTVLPVDGGLTSH